LTTFCGKTQLFCLIYLFDAQIRLHAVIESGICMPAKKFELESMSLDELWSLHIKVSEILSARIRSEKNELEKRLAILNHGMDVTGQSEGLQFLNGKPRRKYPRVLPKYRNPQTSETWSGRGKRPRWLVAAMKSGLKIEEFRIDGGGGSKSRQRA
jgi:DNA-binding protein H-NS